MPDLYLYFQLEQTQRNLSANADSLAGALLGLDCDRGTLRELRARFHEVADGAGGCSQADAGKPLAALRTAALMVRLLADLEVLLCEFSAWTEALTAEAGRWADTTI